jgi:putative ubiquitin-RnfH superfamily antitoxin RatB of RatAB toxin-antitoxin module
MLNQNDENNFIVIELIYALPKQQNMLTIKAAKNSTILSAIKQSKILEKHPEIDLNENKVGIFSRVSQLTDTLQDGDRIEIYRALIADPKEVRKQRALKKK